jgi:hypothetical protein
MTRLEKLLNRCFQHKVVVNCDRDPYLYRWYIFRTKRVALFLHKFVRSDEDRALHDHPWAFLVIPIWRGYVEHIQKRVSRRTQPSVKNGFQWHENWVTTEPSKRRVWPIIGMRYRRATYRHRVELFRQVLKRRGSWIIQTKELPSWSFFFRFRETRTWGFWPKEGFIAWNKWWQNNCE